MMKNLLLQVICITLLLLQPLSRNALSDEGMWLLNDFPTDQVAKKYGFKATQSWLDHVRLSSARLAGGCSGSFISKDGLVMTNHHCAHSCIEQLSTPKKDFIAAGFYAKKSEDEVKCPEIEINRLTGISDVTDQVNKATHGLSGKEYNDAQKAAMARIEKDCSAGSDSTRCDVVTLYHGGKYHLYKYQRYQDVRLVFAPELSIAFFGGDPDNFNFPRYDLDLSLLRVYENGKPLQNDHFFKWSERPAVEGDLTFVTGHPGRTSRLLTISELEFQRDVQLLNGIVYMSELRGMLTEYQNRGPEQKRTSEALLFGIENGLKAYKGRQLALMDKDFMAKKVSSEKSLRKKVDSNAKLKKLYASAWNEIAQAENRFREIYLPYSYLERNHDFNSSLYGIAKTLVRSAAELPKPNEKRLREFGDSKLPQIKQELFSEAPIYDELETALITFSLTKLRENLGADNPAVKRILGTRSPAQIAQDLVKNTKLKDIRVRKALFEGGQKAIDASNDPMIQFAMLIDPEGRAVRKIYEDEIESVLKRDGERIAKAEFAVHGSSNYPDATFTLRASYGQIKGYKENGHEVHPITTFKGTFERHTGSDPFALPESWLSAKSKLNLDTPMNFCSTNDIIGGNSGSPVINKDAEVVGLIFDGNIQSLGGDFGFDESVNRAVAVHSSAIMEALKNVYHADRIVSEITPAHTAVAK
jgi:V8-like Glu-specific endopeptidase